MTDELSITISAGIAPSWHTRVVHDNFDDAFKTLDGLVDRRPTKINVLTWLGKIGNKYSESASTDNISDAITALGQHDAAVERLTKPAHPFKVGDRVFFGGAKGVVDGLVDDTRIKVRWDDTTHGSLALVERLRMEAAENPFERQLKVGDQVAWIGSGPKGLKGTVTAEGRSHTWVQWSTDSNSMKEKVEDLRKIESLPYKVGDRVRYVPSASYSSNPGIGIVHKVFTPSAAAGITNYRYGINWSKGGVSTENGDHLKLEQIAETVIEPGDRVRLENGGRATVLKPGKGVYPDERRVIYDIGGAIRVHAANNLTKTED